MHSSIDEFPVTSSPSSWLAAQWTRMGGAEGHLCVVLSPWYQLGASCCYPVGVPSRDPVPKSWIKCSLRSRACLRAVRDRKALLWVSSQRHWHGLGFLFLVLHNGQVAVGLRSLPSKPCEFSARRVSSKAACCNSSCRPQRLSPQWQITWEIIWELLEKLKTADKIC